MKENTVIIEAEKPVALADSVENLLCKKGITLDTLVARALRKELERCRKKELQ